MSSSIQLAKAGHEDERPSIHNVELDLKELEYRGSDESFQPERKIGSGFLAPPRSNLDDSLQGSQASLDQGYLYTVNPNEPREADFGDARPSGLGDSQVSKDILASSANEDLLTRLLIRCFLQAVELERQHLLRSNNIPAQDLADTQVLRSTLKIKNSEIGVSNNHQVNEPIPVDPSRCISMGTKNTEHASQNNSKDRVFEKWMPGISATQELETSEECSSGALGFDYNPGKRLSIAELQSQLSQMMISRELSELEVGLDDHLEERMHESNLYRKPEYVSQSSRPKPQAVFERGPRQPHQDRLVYGLEDFGDKDEIVATRILAEERHIPAERFAPSRQQHSERVENNLVVIVEKRLKFDSNPRPARTEALKTGDLSTSPFYKPAGLRLVGSESGQRNQESALFISQRPEHQPKSYIERLESKLMQQRLDYRNPLSASDAGTSSESASGMFLKRVNLSGIPLGKLPSGRLQLRQDPAPGVVAFPHPIIPGTKSSGASQPNHLQSAQANGLSKDQVQSKETTQFTDQPGCRTPQQLHHSEDRYFVQKGKKPTFHQASPLPSQSLIDKLTDRNGNKFRSFPLADLGQISKKYLDKVEALLRSSADRKVFHSMNSSAGALLYKSNPEKTVQQSKKTLRSDEVSDPLASKRLEGQKLIQHNHYATQNYKPMHGTPSRTPGQSSHHTAAAFDLAQPRQPVQKTPAAATSGYSWRQDNKSGAGFYSFVGSSHPVSAFSSTGVLNHRRAQSSIKYN